jgi:hypothetical protein
VTSRRSRSLVLAALFVALVPTSVPAERDPEPKGRSASFEAGSHPFHPAIAPDRGKKRLPFRAEEGRRTDPLATALLRVAAPRAEPSHERAEEPDGRDALTRWCLCHSTSSASP